tara:strand:+ start:39 stop:356 length:318 start_codon:yes stop_codon:yes gene_type:complete
MKLTKHQLEQIIQEELQQLLNEGCSKIARTWSNKVDAHEGVTLGWTDDSMACHCAGKTNVKRCWVDPETGEVITTDKQFQKIKESQKGSSILTRRTEKYEKKIKP